MANQAIAMSTGATLNGRALARIAAVTLDSNVIVKPTP
jgi:ice-binding like protein